MNRTFTLLFYLKRTKIDENGKAPIYCRITVDGERAEISIKRSIEPARWNPESNRVKGISEEVKSINSYIDIVQGKLYDTHRDLLHANKNITADAIKNSYQGVDEKRKTLITVFKHHNAQVKALIGKEFSAGTLDRYETVVRLLLKFLKWNFRTDDILLSEINHKFITDFEFYLKSERHNSHNTAVKYIKNFKKIIRIAIANAWLDKDPFINYKQTVKEVERGFLTEDELQSIMNKKLHTPRLDQVRDIFLFCCFTGLAYADVKKLSSENISKGIDGEQWIQINRTKTDTRSAVPILPIPSQLLEKYLHHPENVSCGRVLPVLSNQKMNAYLKEIADLCEIKKNLTTHLARHTFATTVTLANHMPIESVSKMLGHKNIKTTQHYAKILDRTVADDMKILREKFQNAGAMKIVSSPVRKTKFAS